MKAIILLAGYGSRMQPLTINTPKCLLKLSDKETILERQFRILRNCNINKFVVVIGFKKELIKQKLDVILHGKQVIIYLNPLFKTTGNAFSLWTSREAFDDDLLILNGDILFSEETLKDIMKEENTYSLLMKKKKCDQEDQKAKVKNSLILEVGKGLPLDEAYGEVAGMGKIRKEGLEIFKDVLSQGVKENPRIHWPEIFNYLIGKNHEVHMVLTAGFYRDLDTKEDYLEAKKALENK